MANLQILYEHASGYALFTVKEFEEVGMLLPQVMESVTELKRFNQIVKIASFSPFKTALSALENMNSISEGLVTEELEVFLEQSLEKKKNLTLGVQDSKLAATISENLGLQCLFTGAVPEIMRGIRLHFDRMVKGLSSKSGSVAQLGLGHSYSRAKVKFNVNRVDNMIIQSISLLDQMDKDINTFAMRIREWYSYHFPELYKIVPENYTYSKLAHKIGNRKRLSEEDLESLTEITQDESKSEAILKASRSSMGMDISDIDLMNIEMFAKRVVALSEYRTSLVQYLSRKMNGVAPNLAALIGDQVGARLISSAGSLTNLAKFPASTVQVIGAEKALFRALKTRSNTPKYGLLYHSAFITKAQGKNKGRISRFLANKCSLASRIDCFCEFQTNIYGQNLKQQVEERLQFYQNGDIPRKNVDVMSEALKEATAAQAQEKKKKKKEKKKSQTGNDESLGEQSFLDTSEVTESAKKKKKRKSQPENGEEPSEVVEEPQPKKKKKKSSMYAEAEVEADDSINNGEAVNGTDSLKKKKKKKKSMVETE